MAWWKKTEEEKERQYRSQRLREIRDKDIALLRGERQRAEIKLMKAQWRRGKLEAKTQARLAPSRKRVSGMFSPPMDLGFGYSYTPTKKKKNKLFDF